MREGHERKKSRSAGGARVCKGQERLRQKGGKGRGAGRVTAREGRERGKGESAGRAGTWEGQERRNFLLISAKRNEGGIAEKVLRETYLVVQRNMSPRVALRPTTTPPSPSIGPPARWYSEYLNAVGFC